MLPKTFKIQEIVTENSQTKTFLLDASLPALPGQFVMTWVPGVDEKPMSIGSASPVSLSIASVGPFSSALHSLKVGDKVWIRGPLGNHFKLKGKKIILVAGGYGVAPLRFLAREAQKKGIEVKMIMGARSKELMMLPPECETLFATNDGSLGHKGFVTDVLEPILRDTKADCIYSCGPELMLYSIARQCERYGIECELSAEREMKCGIGICGSCVLDDSLVCVDGTIYPGHELLKKDDFGKWKRDATGARVKV